MIAELASAATLGLLTAISPCPLATNIAAVSYLGRHADTPHRSIWSGTAYVAGRTICYALLAAALVGGLLAAATASSLLNRYFGLLVGPVLIIAGGMLLDVIPAPSFGSASGKLSKSSPHEAMPQGLSYWVWCSRSRSARPRPRCFSAASCRSRPSPNRPSPCP